MFEACIRRLLHKKGWTKVHILQAGFQDKTGALEAVYAMHELTCMHERMKQPLTLVLLDIKKAYDRTPRALI
jgi:hypothetical protein